MRTIMRMAALLALGLSMQACASITTGTDQSVAVDTTPVQQATCTLANEKGQWTVAKTPGSVTVNKAYGPLSVNCKTDAGHNGSSSVESTTAGAAFGNIIAGGLIGAAVDMGSGAAYKYPAQVLVSMSGPAQPAAPAVGPIALAPSLTSAAPTQALCRLKNVEEYRDESWCREAGGKVIRVGPPPQPVVVAAPSAPAPSIVTQPATPTAATTPVAASGLCYLPDGTQEPLSKEACSEKKGFIGA